MAQSIAWMSPSLKDKAAAFLNPTFIAAVARRQGLAWRETSLALPRLVSFFARQVLGGNLSMPQLARLGGSLFTPEAYCTARMKLPVSLLYAIVYNAVRLVMLEAAAKQEAAADRISFADALYWVRHGDLLGALPRLQIVPYRPNRLEPRVRKRRNDKYKLMTQPRWQMRQALLRKGVRP